MAIPTDTEPVPRGAGDRPVTSYDLQDLRPLPAHIETPSSDFFHVLVSRRSRVGGNIRIGLLSSLLWHATQLRERRFDGRFGQWESRPSPSAGGIHPIRLLVLPLNERDDAGIYDDVEHSLGQIDRSAAAAIALNAISVKALTGALTGTTVQLVADPTRIAACYENHSSLLWRDAGAVTATLCLTAQALGLNAVPVGRHGTEIARAFGMLSPVLGVGAVHIGAHPHVENSLDEPLDPGHLSEKG